MALSDLQLKVASETAVLGIKKHMAPLSFFAHNFKELEDRPGAAIAVPVYNLSAAAEYSSENNWGTTEDINGVTVTLDKHFIKSVGLDDVTASEGDINFLKDGTQAIVDVLGHAVNAYAFGLINATNVPVSAEVSLSSKAAFAQLFATANSNGVNPYESVLVLDPANFAALLGTQDALVRGTDDAVKYGVVEGLYGFRGVVCSSNLSGCNGAIIPYGSFGVAARVNAPAIQGYTSTFTAVDDNGLAIGFRTYENLAEGKAILGGDILFGAKILQSGIIRLVNAA